MSKKKFIFERFDVYQRSLKFSNRIYDLTKKSPETDKFGLSSQLRRASMSISFNLAEGFCNHYKNNKIRFYRFARGSTNECIPGLVMTKIQKYLTNKEYDELYEECYELSCMISGLIKSIQNRK